MTPQETRPDAVEEHAKPIWELLTAVRALQDSGHNVLVYDEAMKGIEKWATHAEVSLSALLAHIEAQGRALKKLASENAYELSRAERKDQGHRCVYRQRLQAVRQRCNEALAAIHTARETTDGS